MTRYLDGEWRHLPEHPLSEEELLHLRPISEADACAEIAAREEDR